MERYRQDATFSCRTLSLIPCGLRAVLIYRNADTLFFTTPKSMCVLHPTENRTASDKKPYFIRLTSALHDSFFVEHIFPKQDEMHFMSSVGEPQDYEK